jgi:hypothetical protein
MPERATPTDWKQVYERYARLERHWSVSGAPEPVARQFFRRIVHGHRSEAAILREFHSFRLDPPGSDLLDEAFYLQHALYPAGSARPDGRHPDDPLDDVYAAALSMLPHGFWVESPNHDQVYRGQRNATWSAIPSLFRGGDTPDALVKLAAAAARIRASGLSLNDEQVIAVAQHYSKELGVATWLIDVTYDPRVALFFASDGGREGDIGVVNCIVRHEWERLSANGTNRLGRLRVIDVPGILRIERQRASFLDTSHPDLFEQYVADTVWFRQVEGLRFEDHDASHSITGERMYPSDDPLIEALRHANPAPAVALTTGPASDAREPLGSDAYWEIAQSWCRQAGIEIDAYHEDTLRVVCDVHAHMQNLRTRFGVPDRSLHQLHQAVDLVMAAQRNARFITPRQALEWSLSRLKPKPRADLEAIITTCAHARDLC